MKSKNRKPLVSIILPTHNRGYIIGRTIENIFKQTFRDWELIIIDDASSDNTPEVVRQFHNNRITYIVQKQNQGEAAARNLGIKTAKGIYIANQDSDDLWHHRKLEEEVSIMSNAPVAVGAVYSAIERVSMDGATTRVPSISQQRTSGNLHTVFLRGDFYITSQAVLIKKECIEKTGGFDENLRLLNDAEFCIRFSKYYEFLHNPHVRVTVQVGKDSHSRNTKNRTISRDYIFKKHLSEYKKDKDIFSKNAYNIGNAYALQGKMTKAAAYLGRAVKAMPLNIKYINAFLFSLSLSKRLYRFAGRVYLLKSMYGRK